jgi:hypothetical protein
MGPRVVYDTKSVLFKEFVYENFRSNLNTLRKKVKGDKDSAAFDSAALQNNKRRHPAAAITARGHIHWHGSEAKRVLREDLDKGLEELMDPEDLWNFRDEYMMFLLAFFCRHIY